MGLLTIETLRHTSLTQSKHSSKNGIVSAYSSYRQTKPSAATFYRHTPPPPALVLLSPPRLISRCHEARVSPTPHHSSQNQNKPRTNSTQRTTFAARHPRSLATNHRHTDHLDHNSHPPPHFIPHNDIRSPNHHLTTTSPLHPRNAQRRKNYPSSTLKKVVSR